MDDVVDYSRCIPKVGKKKGLKRVCITMYKE